MGFSFQNLQCSLILLPGSAFVGAADFVAGYPIDAERLALRALYAGVARAGVVGRKVESSPAQPFSQRYFLLRLRWHVSPPFRTAPKSILKPGASIQQLAIPQWFAPL